MIGSCPGPECQEIGIYGIRVDARKAEWPEHVRSLVFFLPQAYCETHTPEILAAIASAEIWTVTPCGALEAVLRDPEMILHVRFFKIAELN